MRYTRRDVMKTLAALPLLPLERAEPEVILVNGLLTTMSATPPHASAIAIGGGRFLAVGSDKDVLALAGRRTRRVDLGRRRVFPGFNDAHAHPWAGGLAALKNVACDKSSIEEILAALRARAAETAPGHWVQGYLYDDAKTPRFLTRADLDAAVPDHPVVVTHRGGHTGYVNSLALAQVGAMAATPDPPGGRFEHDASGELNGRVADQALNLILAKIPDDATRDDHRRGVALISKLYSSHGITSVCEADTSPQGLQAYQDARDAGELTYRVYCLMGVAYLDRYIAAGVHTGFGDSMVRIGGIKQYADGSISERTAWLAEPYVGIPGYSGVELGTRESLYENARRAHLAGFQLATHANGERAIDRILGVYEELQREFPRRDPRFRIEHCTVVTPELIARMRAIEAIPIPFAGYVTFHGDVLHFYGEERVGRMFAYRSFIDAGLKAPSASDYTASPPDPMLWLYSETTRRDPTGHVWGERQRITLAEALKSMTLDGAYASFEEHDKGSIEPGKLADLVVLEEDPIELPAERWQGIKVERTMLGGQWVYEA
ncbi:MAG TPA: amidohydrolase [Steroidobacteraceae bacterium]|nr:amidohydrolase [Steroidobacteraceae bacterium]